MKPPLGILILTVAATFSSGLIADTLSRAASSSGGLNQPTRPGIIRPDSKLAEPSPRFLLQKITALEKEVGTLKEEVKLLKTHRHNHKRTAIPGGCGWMALSVFFYQVENNPKFKTDCGLLVGSTTPSKNIPDKMKSNFTSKPVY
jgi:hypothetical protein